MYIKNIVASALAFSLVFISSFSLACSAKKYNTQQGVSSSAHASHLNMNEHMGAMTERMKGKTGAELEKIFLEDMIIHHQGALDMAQILKQNTTRPELIKMADDIINVQTVEIQTMQNWLKDWFKENK